MPTILSAYYNHARWVVDCPECNGAEIVMPTNPFFKCLNLECGFEAAVQFPEEREEIERVTALRPRPVNRNWLPGETVLDLAGENLSHGLIEEPI